MEIIIATFFIILVLCILLIHISFKEKETVIKIFMMCLTLSAIILNAIAISSITTVDHYRKLAIENKAAHWKIHINQTTGEIDSKEFVWGKQNPDNKSILP